jgi:tetratricopeptide (TPR) repeat protein
VVAALVVLGGLFLIWQYDPWGWRRGPRDGALAYHWHQTLNALEDYDYDLAKTHLSDCLEISPYHARAHFLMARACRLTGEGDAWREHLRVAEFLDWPQEEIALEHRLGEAQSKNIWLVEEGLKRDVLEAAPAEKILILEALIKGYLENDRAKDAYRLAYAWTMDYPDDWLAFLYLGRGYQHSNLPSQAIAAFEKVLQLKPDQDQGRLWLGETLIMEREYEAAIRHFETYLKKHPGDPDGLLRLARCQLSLGQTEEARKSLDDLLRTDENDLGGLLTLAALEQTEGADKALPWLRKAEAIAPNNPTVLASLIPTLHALHRDKEAEDYNQRLKDRQPKINRLQQLRTELIENQNDVELRFQVGALSLELGMEEEAAHWFQTVLWIDPYHRPTLRALANYWRKRGALSRAAHYSNLAEGKLPPSGPRAEDKVPVRSSRP